MLGVGCWALECWVLDVGCCLIFPSDLLRVFPSWLFKIELNSEAAKTRSAGAKILGKRQRSDQLVSENLSRLTSAATREGLFKWPVNRGLHGFHG
jgi:hypothetical protein